MLGLLITHDEVIILEDKNFQIKVFASKAEIKQTFRICIDAPKNIKIYREKIVKFSSQTNDTNNDKN